MMIASYLITGVFAGLVAGLLGVGGGIIVVPILILCFESQGFSTQVLTHMAVGTSLATIVFTSTSSIVTHHRLGSVMWPVFKPIALGIAFGAILGVLTVVQLDGQVLKKLIGVFAIIVALRMWFRRVSSGQHHIPDNKVLVAVGVVVGWVSSIFGIGGGTLTVPYLNRCRIEMKKVVGTAAACGFPIAVLGSATNGIVGLGVEGRPDWSIGYIYLPAMLCIVVTSMYFAKLGARWANKLPSAALRHLFAALLMLVGVRFLTT
jgi:hypothetical protein